MKFFLDENFPRPALVLLRDDGHKRFMHLTPFRPGLTTKHYSPTLKRKLRSLLRRTKIFFHTVPLSFKRHSGAIVITLRKPNRADLLRRLSEALATLGDRNLENAAWLVTDTRIYSRQPEI